MTQDIRHGNTGYENGETGHRDTHRTQETGHSDTGHGRTQDRAWRQEIWDPGHKTWGHGTQVTFKIKTSDLIDLNISKIVPFDPSKCVGF